MARFNHGQVDEATERMGRSFEVLSSDDPDADLAMLAGQLARFRFLLGDLDGAIEPLEFALEIAEALVLPGVLSDALNTKGLIAAQRGHREEALGLMRHAVDIAVENDLGESALRAYFNLSFLMAGRDRIEDARAIDEQGRALAQRRGNRQWEEAFTGHMRGNQLFLGHWDDITPPMDELGDRSWDDLIWAVRLDFAGVMIPLYVARGQLADARRILGYVPSEPRVETQERASVAIGRAAFARGEGGHEEALEFVVEACSLRGSIGPDHPNFKQALAGGLESAVALGDFSRVEPILEQVRELSPGMRSPFVEAQLARYDAHRAARDGDPEKAEQRFLHAAALSREIGARFWLAVVLLEESEWLIARGQDGADLLAEAREIFDRLGARPWLERAEALAPAPV